jgi:catechol 2,3-dioxygenase-like lactoylglutathione lyase family enzyme
MARSTLGNIPQINVMKVDRLDHLVLTVKDLDATCRFYVTVLGMELVTFSDSRKALVCGSQRIHLHQTGQELEPKAYRPTPGSADLCFLVDASMGDVLAHVRRCGVKIILGPGRRTGAVGELESVYFRDPDLNLLEVATLVNSLI